MELHSYTIKLRLIASLPRTRKGFTIFQYISMVMAQLTVIARYLII